MHKGLEEEDIFEDIKQILGCEYISDIVVKYKSVARRLVNAMNLNSYPICQLNDLYEYLYGEKRDFFDYDVAIIAFKQACK